MKNKLAGVVSTPQNMQVYFIKEVDGKEKFLLKQGLDTAYGLFSPPTKQLTAQNGLKKELSPTLQVSFYKQPNC